MVIIFVRFCLVMTELVHILLLLFVQNLGFTAVFFGTVTLRRWLHVSLLL